MCLVTQHSEPNDTDVTPPSVREVVDQALVRPSVCQLGVVDEDGGTCTWHGGHKAHTTIEVVSEAEHLATLVNDHLNQGITERGREGRETDKVGYTEKEVKFKKSLEK